MNHIINLVIQIVLFHDVIKMTKLKSYDESEKSEKLENKTKKKFQLFEFFNQLHNIIVHIHSFANHMLEFSALTSRMILLDN